MIRVICQLVVMFFLCFSNVANALEKGLSFDDGGAETPIGSIVIKKYMKQADEVLLNGAIILRGDNNHFSWFVSSASPRKGLASLVLLSFDTGDNSCRFLHRVLEITPERRYQLSPEFGNCQEFEDSELPPYENTKKPNPKFVNGQWWLGFRPFLKGKTKVWYVYQNGQIFRDGKKVEGPDFP